MSIIETLSETLKPRREARSAMISYRTTPELKKILKDYAKNQGMNMQQLITDALLVYLKQKKEMLEEESENVHNA